MSEKKYYWLKLHKDFFKQHDTRIIEEMENGKDYLLFYLKLLAESVSHEGHLRFSDTIPYNDKMLSTITNTNIDIVRAAVTFFKDLQLLEILDDGTIFMTEVEKIMGSETEWAEKKRIYRNNRGQIEGQKRTLSDKRLDIRDKSIDIEKDNNISLNNNNLNNINNSIVVSMGQQPQKHFIKPTIDEIKAYCVERNNNIDCEYFYDHYEKNGWMAGKVKMRDWKAAVRTWEKNNFDNKKTDKQQETTNPYLKKVMNR